MAEPPVSVVYRGVTYKRNPDARQRAGRVYYVAPRGSGHDSLHRDIWRDGHPGEAIPPGWHIHHKDHDPFNNDPGNLVLVSPPEHGQEHKDEFADARRAHAEAIRPLAAEWHRSAEGHDWHVEHGKRTWENREPTHSRTCADCGAEFLTVWGERGDERYCSRRCVNRARERKYLETVVCPICGSEFQQDKYRKRPETCSRKCGWALRRARAA